MRDIYGNELKEKDLVIYKSDKYESFAGEITQIGDHFIKIMVYDKEETIFSKNSYVVPVILIGSLIINTTNNKLSVIKDLVE